MRTIKFRYTYQHQETGRIAVSECYTLIEIERGHLQRSALFLIKHWEIIARDQFTGFTDKHGNDICEGDLISNESGRVCEVVWFQPAGIWDAEVRINIGNALDFGCTSWRYTEIIGNVHDNPESWFDKLEFYTKKTREFTQTQKAPAERVMDEIGTMPEGSLIKTV